MIFFIQLTGGLGNQLFQFAHALHIKTAYREARLIFLYSGTGKAHEICRLKELGIEAFIVDGRAATLIRRILVIAGYFFPFTAKVFREHSVLKPRSINLVLGLYQSAPEALVVRFLRLKILNMRLFSFDPNSVGAHVRLGDYLHPNVMRSIGSLLPEYYMDAFTSLPTIYDPDVVFYTNGSLSDLRRYLHNTNYTWELRHGTSDLDDLRRLATHGAIICSNSTFCLWAAYLSHASHVIVPKYFTKLDMDEEAPEEVKYFDNWTIIGNYFADVISDTETELL